MPGDRLRVQFSLPQVVFAHHGILAEEMFAGHRSLRGHVLGLRKCRHPEIIRMFNDEGFLRNLIYKPPISWESPIFHGILTIEM